jgi:putative SOS response-associated peptidase YedK
MCGRYALVKSAGELIEEFAISFDKNFKELPFDWNVAPTKDIYIIKNDGEGNKVLSNVSWGLIAPWAHDAQEAIKSQSMAINARSESVDVKPTFKNAFRHTRCLIPATGYYEWATELGPYKPKQPFFISSETPNKTLAFTGIYSSWVDPASGEIRNSAALLTRHAVGFLATVHSRMPVFLPRDRWADWLDSKNTEVDYLKMIIDIPHPDEGLLARPVSDAVNSIKNNGTELTAPIELQEPETLF